jgi:hypothetical protein
MLLGCWVVGFSRPYPIDVLDRHAPVPEDQRFWPCQGNRIVQYKLFYSWMSTLLWF